MEWTLDVGEKRWEMEDAVQLQQQLFAAHQQATYGPIIALLNAPDGSCMAIGLGFERCVLNHISPGGWPSRHAVDNSAGEGLAEYRLAGQISEVPLRDTVQIKDAIDACIDFMASGRVSEKIDWEDD